MWLSLAACGLVIAGAGPAAAAFVTDPVGDFLASYTGPRPAPDLDVVGAEVTYNGTTFRFFAELAGAVGTTPGGFYAWGLDRGQGAPLFAALGLPGVLFDSVLAARPDGTGAFVDLTNGVTTPLAAGAVTVSGNTITAVISADAIAPRGRSRDQFTWNLWPRLAAGGGIGGGGAQPIPDFAPDNSTAAVTVTPVPASAVLLGLGGLTAAGLRRRRLG
jgi:hypothetical protein